MNAILIPKIKSATIFLHGDMAAGLMTTTIEVSDLEIDMSFYEEDAWQEVIDDLRDRLMLVGKFFDPPGGVTVLLVGWDMSEGETESGPGDEAEEGPFLTTGGKVSMARAQAKAEACLDEEYHGDDHAEQAEVHVSDDDGKVNQEVAL